MIFVTDDGSAEGSGPMLFVPEAADAVLPKNPRAYPWRYFATVSVSDGLVDHRAAEALASGKSYVSNRLISRPP